MRRILHAIWLPALLTSGCAHFDYAVDEFDSVTGLRMQTGEPEEFAYRDEARQWSWLLHALGGSGMDWCIGKLFAMAPSMRVLDNPSSYVRDRMHVLTEQALGDLFNSAHAASRLLWIAAEDHSHPLNQVIALTGLRKLMTALELAPTGQDFSRLGTRSAQEFYLTDRRLLTAGWPTRRPAVFSPADQQAYLSALQRLSRSPAADPRQGRDLLRDLAYRLSEEGDGQLADATEIALRAVLANEITAGLCHGLRSTSSEVREIAILALYELSGPVVVPYCLAVLHSRGGGAVAFDPSPELRRVLIRICGQLRGDVLYHSVTLSSGGQGPTPIRFLYETIKGDSEEGLRTVALESMALCLGKPIVFEQRWADEWWREYVLRGAEGSKGEY